MGWFDKKKKVQAEDFGRELIDKTIPRAIKFFHEENGRAHQKAPLKDDDLFCLGSGVTAFFLSKHLPESVPASHKKYSRVLSGIRKGIRSHGAKVDKMNNWLKAFSDEEIFYKGEHPLMVCNKVIWTRTFPEVPFKEHAAIKGFTYFIQMEVSSIEKIKLV